MRKFKLFIVLITVLFSMDCYSQQDPEYTQYMYNMNVLNPAYAGSKGTLSINLLGRAQWVNIKGAPRTYSLSVHAPVRENIGIGLSVIADEIGPVKEQNIYADFSYTVNTSTVGKLAFGFKGGITLHNLDALSLMAIDPNDPFNLDLNNKTFPNFGAGIFYYTDRFYVSLSVPNILEQRHFEKDNGVYKAAEKAHYFLTGGYVFDISENWKFKPSTMVRAQPETPLSVDISANFLFNNIVELGASYRLDDSISGLVNFSITNNFRIGYAYDYTTSNLGDFNDGSHEVFLLWDLDFSRDNVDSPRFF